MPGNYFFVDIDGTIVSTDYKLDSKVKKIINNEKDIKIVLVTGRLAASIQSLELKVDAICSNGSEIVYVNGETKRIACFTYDRVDEICNLIDKKIFRMF